jgi:hypothetical protein
MPVQIGRPVRQPYGPAFTELSFGDVDRVIVTGCWRDQMNGLPPVTATVVPEVKLESGSASIT